MAINKENEALQTQKILGEVTRWLQQRLPNLEDNQSTQGDYAPGRQENEDGTWTIYWSTLDEVGTLPCGP